MPQHILHERVLSRFMIRILQHLGFEPLGSFCFTEGPSHIAKAHHQSSFINTDGYTRDPMVTVKPTRRCLRARRVDDT